MLRFFALRLLRAFVTIVLVVTFAFVVLRLSGDPALIILGPESAPEAIAAFRKSWGLDEPLWRQYFSYFGAIAQGELGRSMRDGRSAIELVAERIPATLALTIPALLLKVGIGIPAGIFAALHRGSLADRLVMLLSVAGFTVPSFVLGLVLVLIFAVQLGWLPSGGQDSWRHAILPIVTLGVGGNQLIGYALAAAAGTFLCIATSDLLPELQFHTHDRFRLSAALLAGLGLAAAIVFFEERGHDHHLPAPPVPPAANIAPPLPSAPPALP